MVVAATFLALAFAANVASVALNRRAARRTVAAIRAARAANAKLGLDTLR